MASSDSIIVSHTVHIYAGAILFKCLCNQAVTTLIRNSNRHLHNFLFVALLLQSYPTFWCLQDFSLMFDDHSCSTATDLVGMLGKMHCVQWRSQEI